MANTLQTAMDLAQIPLNDAAKDRYTAPNALIFCNHVILAIYRARPDFWLGSDWVVPNGSLAANTLLSDCKIPDEYIQTLADLITARFSMTDDEFISSGRVDMFLKLFGVQASG